MVKQFKYLSIIIFAFFVSCNNKKKDFNFVTNEDLYKKSVQEILTDTMKSGTFFYSNFTKSYINENAPKFKNTLVVISRMKIDMIEKQEGGIVKYCFLETGINTNKTILCYNKFGKEYESDYNAKLIKHYNKNWSEMFEKIFNF